MADKIDPERHKEQVRLFVEERKSYIDYSRILKRVLRAACKLHAPLSVVEARAKSIASFAEKAARKSEKYKDPLHQITDLCGARVIVSTEDQREAVCRFIRDNFIIDEANSLDAGSRLKESEFGYHSFHFVVQIGQTNILGVDIPLEKIGKRKAEIQVRTILQHAWASITHDRLYKSSFKAPQRLNRLAHRVAALLESADSAFNEFERDMHTYLGCYTAYMSNDEIRHEMDILDMVLSVESEDENKPPIALRIARLARAACDIDKAISTLAPFKTVNGPWRLPILVELGISLVEKCHGDQADPRFESGREMLLEAVGGSVACAGAGTRDSAGDRKLRASAAAALAACSVRHDACAFYTDALEFDADDPYILCSQLAFNLKHTGCRAIIDSARSAILQAIDVCRKHLDAGLELPRAWFTMGRLYLLLRRNADALDSYAKAIHFYLSHKEIPWFKESFQAELDYLEYVQEHGKSGLPEIGWTDQFLRMAYWLKNGRNGSVTRIAKQRANKYSGFEFFPESPRVLIVAGGAREDLQKQMESYHNLLKAAIDNFDGIVLSGGTTAGIPGVLGNVAAELKSENRKAFILLGYHPTFLPAAVTISEHYDQHIPSGGKEGLGFAEPLQMWLDLFAAGVEPERVRLLGINGGDISRFEYALALAFGARVGLIQSSGRSADHVLLDPDWSKDMMLLPLPDDAMTAQAFVQVGTEDVPDAKLEIMGKYVHDQYRKDSKPDYLKPNTLPWEFIPEDFRRSSREQAAFAITMLRKKGYKVTGVSAPPQVRPILDKHIESLAEMEHGRWNVERLCAGWRFASDKDNEKKLSPYLVAWSQLPQGIRDYDRKAVRFFPEVLAAGGYELEAPEDDGR